MRKNFYLSLTSLLIAVSAIVSLNFMNQTTRAAEPRDCDNNAIINCGALTQNELLNKFDADSTKDLKEVFAKYGLDRSDLNEKTSQVKMGRIYKDGRVVVNGKTVATNAHSIGRQDMPGSRKVTINGKTYYERLDTRNFNSEYLTALVFMRDGKFYRAVQTSCGNPVKATPVRVETPKPEQPKLVEQPKPAPVQPVEQPKPVVVTPVEQPKPAPAADCTYLNAVRIDRTRYRLEATASSSNEATISRYMFNVRENSTTGTVVYTNTVTATTQSASSGEFNLEPGTYFARVTVTTSLGDKTADACTTTFTIPAPNKVEVCNQTTGETMIVEEKNASSYKPVGDAACKSISVCELSNKTVVTIKESDYDTSRYSKTMSDCQAQVKGEAIIPSTGPGDFIGGGLGIGSLTAAAYYWRASRRSLINAFLSR